MTKALLNRSVAAVIIGRNEGERLGRCLVSAISQIDHVVYVDSGSTDGSVEAAKASGAKVVDLDLSRPFTAARARNAGIEALRTSETPAYVQFIDGDCELQPGWISIGARFLARNPQVAVVSGRLRERFPDASVYNSLCDREWNTAIGKVKSCGGIAMYRWTAIDLEGGFNPNLIAGEEPELCVRLRGKGWEVWRLDEEMALHDAAMTRFGQWWKRERRGGHAYAERMALNGALPERDGVAGVRRALFWGFSLPLATVLGSLISLWVLLLLLAYPAQVVRLAVRDGAPGRWKYAVFDVLAKFPQSLGCMQYFTRRLRSGHIRIIEYK